VKELRRILEHNIILFEEAGECDNKVCVTYRIGEEQLAKKAYAIIP